MLFKKNIFLNVFYLKHLVLVTSLIILFYFTIQNTKEQKESLIEPYAFIRIKNEYPTIHASLESIKSFVKQGVIGYNDCTDGSEEVILQFVKENPKFKAFKYPHTVFGNCDPRHYTSTVPPENNLATYYNAVLQQLPKNVWIIKLDADEIYPSTMKKILEPVTQDTIISFYGIDMHCENDRLYVVNRSWYAQNPNYQETYIRKLYDHFMVFNDSVSFYQNTGSPARPCDSWERVFYGNRPTVIKPVLIYHFSLMKKWRPMEYEKETTLIPFEQYVIDHPKTIEEFPELQDKSLPHICRKFNRHINL